MNYQPNRSSRVPLCTLFLLGMVSLPTPPVRAQAIVSPAKIPPTPDLHEVIQRLGDTNFATRVAAQKDLEKAATYRDREYLAGELAKCTDAETRARLLQCITAIETSLIKEPPPISLELKNAEIPEVAQALADALGVNVGWQRFAYPEPVAKPPFPTYTLSLKNTSLWEVLEALGRQHPLSLADQRFFGLQEVPSHHALPGTYFGCLGIFPMASTEPRQYPDFEFVIDPRIKILKLAPPQWALVTDNLGGVMLTDRNNPDPPWWAGAGLGTWVSNMGGPAYSQAKPGAREIASAKGTVHFTMQIGKETSEQTIPFELKHIPIPAPPATAASTP